MVEELLVFIGLLFLLAVIVRQDFVFELLYLFLGTYLIGEFWSRKSIQAIRYKRTFCDRVFLNEEIPVELEITNSSWLPVVWLRMHESLPVELSIDKYFRRVLTLGPHEKTRFEYILQGRKRGYYRVGPLFASVGDLLGLSGERRSEAKNDYLTVYPKIVPLTHMSLPSRSPMGTMRHNQPVFEDPSRVLSKRDYVAGDSMRRIDWKASAVIGRLQVKQFEPSIALETAIILNLNTEEYGTKSRFDVTELAIVVAASIANWVSGQKQAVGLITNGLDPLAVVENPKDAVPLLPAMRPLPPRKGRGQLMHILDILARVEAGVSIPFGELLRREYINLSWGTTLILITARMGQDFFDQLFQLRRAGLNVVIILVGSDPEALEDQHRAELFNFPVFLIDKEEDLDRWRK